MRKVTRFTTFMIAGLLYFSMQAADHGLSYANQHTPPRFDYKTGKCLVCNGLLEVYNTEYKKNKLGSQRIITCPCCKGQGVIQQTLKSLWGISLYKGYSARDGEIQADKTVKYSFTPRKRYRNYGSYSFFVTPMSKQVCKICARFQAKSKKEANREMDIFIQQMQQKYKDIVVYTALAYSKNMRGSSGSFGGRSVQGNMTEGVYYNPQKTSRLKVIENVDAQITVSVSRKNLVEIVMTSRKLLDRIESEAKKISVTESDLDAL